MRLLENLISRSYHLWDHGWTPLSRNPCFLCGVAHHNYRKMTNTIASTLHLGLIWEWVDHAPRPCITDMINSSQTTYLNPGTVSDESCFVLRSADVHLCRLINLLHFSYHPVHFANRRCRWSTRYPHTPQKWMFAEKVRQLAEIEFRSAPGGVCNPVNYFYCSKACILSVAAHS